MIGYCSSCRQPGEVRMFRLADVGLRAMHTDCADRLSAMGLVLIAVSDTDPRQADRGRHARRHPGFGRRHVAAGLRWLRAVA